MNTSLSKFCKDRGLPKSTVYDRCRELNFDTSHGLTQEMVAQLEHEFGVTVQQQETPLSPTEVMPQGFIQSSTLAPVETREIQLPEGFDPAEMVKFFDGVTGQATNTGSLLVIAEMALGAVEGAMDSKLEEQRQKLTQAQKDAEKLAAKIAETKTNLKVKALESRLLANQQTAVTKSAEELFAELMQMGKPVKPSPPSAS